MVETVNLSTSGDPAVTATAEATAAAASAAKFAAQSAPPVELIAGKFKSNDELLVAYKALEAKLGAPKVEPTVTPPAAPTPAAVDPAAPALAIDATAAAAQAGFKMADLSSEYAANGDLTPATYTKLAAAGIGKDMVDAFVAGQKVIIEAETTAVMAKAGVTKEAFADMIKWAGANLPAEDITAYNQAVAGSAAMKQFALEAMHTRFIRANGSDPQLYRGQSGSAAAGGEVYQSTEQMLKDMRDPLYQRDPAFRATVAAKVARSKLS